MNPLERMVRNDIALFAKMSQLCMRLVYELDNSPYRREKQAELLRKALRRGRRRR